LYASESRITSLGAGVRALVVGATGGIGGAFSALLSDDPAVGELLTTGRSGADGVTHLLDLTDEATIARAADKIGENGPIHLIINATGMLARPPDLLPEKTLTALDPQNMHTQFAINAIGPALLIKHFHKLFPRDRKCVFASLSARVGSIGDNRLGGWHSYRASKAAQNMLMKGAAIELQRKRPDTVVMLLHPGTVQTGLSAPFRGDRDTLTPGDAAARLLQVIDGTGPNETGCFKDYAGKSITW